MRIIHLSLLLVLLFLSACNTPLPNPNPSVDASPSPTEDLVATQVAILRTSMPTATLPVDTPTPQPLPTQAPATNTAEPAAPTTTVTVTVTATTGGELKDTLGQPAWTDSLDTAGNFYLFENEGTRVTAESGALVLTGLQANGWLGWSLTFARQPVNFYLEATFITQNCTGSDHYGLVFRATRENAGYFFGATCAGAYDLNWADFNSGEEKDLIADTSSPEMRSGANQTNRLGVLANGDKISLYANGKLLQETTDTTMTGAGYYGAFVAANQTTGFTVKMDDISLWTLP